MVYRVIECVTQLKREKKIRSHLKNCFDCRNNNRKNEIHAVSLNGNYCILLQKFARNHFNVTNDHQLTNVKTTETRGILACGNDSFI